MRRRVRVKDPQEVTQHNHEDGLHFNLMGILRSALSCANAALRMTRKTFGKIFNTQHSMFTFQRCLPISVDNVSSGIAQPFATGHFIIGYSIFVVRYSVKKKFNTQHTIFNSQRSFQKKMRTQPYLKSSLQITKPNSLLY